MRILTLLLFQLLVVWLLLVAKTSTTLVDSDESSGLNPFANAKSGYVPLSSSSSSSPPAETNMFYWLFDTDPPSAAAAQTASASPPPLVLWLEGGPGIPSTFQVFNGIGPYRLEYEKPFARQSALRTVRNQYSWTGFASLLFVDNPIGVGFSYTNDPIRFARNQSDVGADLVRFLHGFYALYPELVSVPLFVAGESYAGKYVPALINSLLDCTDPTTLLASSLPECEIASRLQLGGMIVGDGLVSPAIQAESWLSYAHGASVLSSQDVRDWQPKVDALVSEIRAQNYSEASNGYFATLMALSQRKLVNMYNVGETTETNQQFSSFTGYETLCNTTEARRQLHVYPQAIPKGGTQPLFMSTFYADVSRPYPQLYERILANRTVPVLIYQGQFDWLVNAPGTEAWIDSLVWSEAETFRQAHTIPYCLPLQVPGYPPGINLVVGQKRVSGLLSLVNVFAAGHFVTGDQPQVAYLMGEQFVTHGRLPRTVCLINSLLPSA